MSRKPLRSSEAGSVVQESTPPTDGANRLNARLPPVEFLFFNPAARKAEKESARRADAALSAKSVITPEQLARKNAFIPYSVDLSQWVVVRDSIADGKSDLFD